MTMLAPQYLPVDGLKTQPQVQSWLDANLFSLEDGGYHYLGGEPNTQPPEMFNTADLRVLIIRLSTYDAVDGSMAHPLMAQIARDAAKKNNFSVFCDYAFLPPRKDYELFMKNQIPVILPTQTKRNPNDFDMIWVSHAVCLERINWPRMMINSGIPLFKNQRMEQDGIPLILMGGAHAFADEDMHGHFDEENYGLVDACVLGDGEVGIARMMWLWGKHVQEARYGKTPEQKRQFIMDCHTKFVPGFYEPDKYDHVYADGKLVDIKPTEGYVEYPIKKAKVWNLDSERTLEERVLWYGVALGGTADVEIARGCGAQCSFCQEASVARPYRERSLEKVKESAWNSRFYQGATEVNLFSFVWNMYSEIYPLLQWLLEKYGLCNLISNRLDMQAEDTLLAHMMKQMGTNATTVGLEGCSERMRQYLHKNLGHQQVLDGCRNIFKGGINELKLFMIATGIEEERDTDEFSALLRSIIDIRNEVGSKAQVRVSFTPLFMCAKTALQWGSCQSVHKLEERTLDPVVQTCRELGIGFRTSAKRSEILMAQLLEMADRRIAPLMIKSSIDDAYIYYGFVPKTEPKRWVARMEEAGLEYDYYFGEKGVDYVFPWDHINSGLSNAYLRKVYEEVSDFQEREYCVGTLSKRGTCTSCQACETPLQIAELTSRLMSEPVDRKDIDHAVRPLHKVNQIRFKVWVDPMFRSVPKRFYSLALGRALIQADTDFMIDHYNKVIAHSRTPASANGQKDWTYGEALIDVSVDEHVSEAHVKSLVDKMNANTFGWKILDVKVMREMQGLASACELALYEIMLPADKFSFFNLDQRVDQYFAKADVKIRKRVAAGKNVFKTEMVDLNKSDVVAVNVFFTGEDYNRVVWSCNAKLNPYFTLEALLGGRSHQYRKFPVKCLGYFKAAVGQGSDDIFAVLSGGSTVCTECDSGIETDSFRGEPYKSVNGDLLCLACDVSRQPTSMVEAVSA